MLKGVTALGLFPLEVKDDTTGKEATCSGQFSRSFCRQR